MFKFELPRPTSDELATILKCKRNNTTKRWTAFTQTACVVVPAVQGLTASGRPDRVAEKIRAFARDIVLLADATPTLLEAILRELASQTSDSPHGR